MTSRVFGHLTEQRCTFIPPFLTGRLSPGQIERDDALRSGRFRTARAGISAAPATTSGAAWAVHDCAHTTELPGSVVRRAGDPETGDPAADEAATGLTASLALFTEVYGRDSYDDNGASVVCSVHYDRNYANAFWDGTQLVFGDGDGEVFDRFTKPVDVLGHEFAHAVTEHTAGLVYRGQSGALNESMSDVFGLAMKQRLLGQSVAEAEWVVGQGLFLPGVSARGLRDMKHPGTAYDDPRLGKDPQPAHMDDFVDTTEDNGGVHINSGIPNRAFVLAAEAIGSTSAEGAGRIWFQALTGADVGPQTDFAGFAAATISAAGEHADAVRTAWEQVGVTPAAANVPGRRGRVKVRRTGGVAGMTREDEVALASGDDRCPELVELLGRLDSAVLAAPEAPSRPDRYVYEFDLDGAVCRLAEPDLPPELRRVAELVLP